jgi:hypothetical protein
MLRRIDDWTMSLAGTHHAEKALAGVSFVENYLGLLFTLFMALLLGGVYLVKVIL